jgi:hypothetical protein
MQVVFCKGREVFAIYGFWWLLVLHWCEVAGNYMVLFMGMMIGCIFGGQHSLRPVGSPEPWLDLIHCTAVHQLFFQHHVPNHFQFGHQKPWCKNAASIFHYIHGSGGTGFLYGQSGQP